MQKHATLKMWELASVAWGTRLDVIIVDLGLVASYT